MGMALILTLSRGGVVSMTIALALMLFFLVRQNMVRSSWWTFSIVVMLAAGALSAFGLGPIIERMVSVQEIGSKLQDLNRIPTWQGTIDLISKNLWFGTGPGTFEYAFFQFRPSDFPFRPGHAHNDYLELLADIGVFAFVAVVFLSGTVVWKGFRLIRYEESRLKKGVGAGCVTAVIALGIHSLIDFNYHIPANWMLISVVAGILFSLKTKKFSGSMMLDGALRFVSLFLMMAVIAGALVLGLSDFFLWKGKMAFKRQHHEEVIAHVDQSIRINSLNAESYYWRGLSSRQAEDFDRAIALNPYEPYYYYNRALAHSRDLPPEALHNAIPWYERAIQMDPKDPKLYYLSGKNLLAMNKSRSALVEQTAKKLFKQCIELDPSYALAVFELLWAYEPQLSYLRTFEQDVEGSAKGLVSFIRKQGLWRDYRQFHLKSLGIDPVAIERLSRTTDWAKEPSDIYELITFESVSEKRVHDEEKFVKNGEIQQKIYFRDSLSRLILYAKGSQAAGAYPYLIVKLDDEVIDAFYLNSPRFKSFYTIIQTAPGEHVIGLEFVNDYYDSESRQDRNIWIERIELQYPLRDTAGE